MKLPKPLVTIDWLEQHLGNPELIILDSSLPKPKSKASDNPLNSIQIPGARFFDIDQAFSDTTSSLPHTMLSEASFINEARKLGIDSSNKLVIYDNLGIYSSPRAWWMFKSMGHHEVAILDGGLPEWVSAEKQTEVKSVSEHAPGDFIATFDPSFFRKASDVMTSIDSKEILVLDARSKGRFDGTEPEPREGLRGGHIPNSISLPFTDVVNGNQLHSAVQLQKIFETKGVKEEELIFSCGSGLTACIIALAAEVAGHDRLSIYDGSWSEWGGLMDHPVDP